MNYFKDAKQAFIIAEIGVNHNGDIKVAKNLIDAAKIAGADAVKFQTFSAKLLASTSTPKVPYQNNAILKNESHLEMLERLELSNEDHIELAEYCKCSGIEFLSTPYDIKSAEFLDSIGVNLFKTASADLIDLPLHRFIASTGKPVFIATGMGSLGEVERVIQIYDAEGSEDIVLLHCVSNYPCSDESINIRAMNTLEKAFGLPVGFSDHSEGDLASVIAVSRGARVIEKHFTLNKDWPGPDHRASATPKEFNDMVFNIRRCEKMLGLSRKARQPEEENMAAISRKSIILARKLNAGSILKEDDFALQRPGNGIPPFFVENLIGKILLSNLPAGHQLKWGDFGDLK
jgi:N,N'-diacetyllegionaminate synthase